MGDQSALVVRLPWTQSSWARTQPARLARSRLLGNGRAGARIPDWMSIDR
jgi:hypothetical protein